MKTQIKGLNGEPIVLTPQELARANALQNKFRAEELHNALGFEINITTLTAISKSIVEQKFFEIAPADYVPVRVGQNAWSSQITTYLDYAIGGDFEAGILNTGASDSRLAEADSGVSPVTNKVVNWAKAANWSLFDLKMAALSGNWDVVTSKERSRKKNWDLGIQQIAFWGSKVDTKVLGLLTQTTVNSNTSLITGAVSAMNATNFSAFVAGLIQAYRANCNYTAFPTHFIMPESDYNGLANLIPGSAGTFPMPMMNYLLDAFKLITRNPNFKILPCAYANEAINTGITNLGKNRYTLLNYDEDTIRMDIPVDYSNTLQNTLNGFQYQNVGYGQFTGVIAFRPLEVLYFDYT
jgi:hypothetical protein